jgi:outer membrane receptor protein involved in Fe transport
MRHLTLRIAALALAILPLAASATPAKFDIPAGTAPAALMAFSKQARQEIVFSADALKQVRTAAVKGDYEPDQALSLLLRDTGFVATRGGDGKYVVTRAKATGSVEGSLYAPPGSGRRVAGISVAVSETGASATVDSHGQYSFSALAPGTYTLVATGEGFSRLRITGVVVSPDHLLTLGAQEMPMVVKDGEVQMMAEIVVHANKDVEVMEKYVVTDAGATKPAPFSGSNFDLPRGVDDIQPYFIWDSARIENSGAVDVQDFFQKMVPMNTGKQTGRNFGNGNGVNNYSNISLNGLSGNNLVTANTQNTLILMDGLPLPAYSQSTLTYQPNVNGISLMAIDHIEVLPSSASAIYGANASGGVINIVLKHDYTGLELDTSYANTFGTDAPVRNVSVTLGQAMEGGKTNLLLTLGYKTEKALRLQDRTQIVGPNEARYFSLYPGGQLAYLGLTTTTGAVPTTAAGVYLNTPVVRSASNKPLISGTTATQLQIPAGYQGFQAGGIGPLQANIGAYDLSHPNDADPLSIQGALAPLYQAPKDKSAEMLVRRQMTPWLEAFAEFSYNSVYSVAEGGYNYVFGVTVPATAPGNPFGQAVTVSSGNATPTVPVTYTNQVNRIISAGAKISLPDDWKGELDFSWGKASFYSWEDLTTGDSVSLAAAAASGAVNLIKDLSLYPLPPLFDDYVRQQSVSTTQSVQLKAAGPLMKLWAGVPTLAVGLGSQGNGSSFGYSAMSYADRAAFAASTNPLASYSYYPGQRQTHGSGYAELQVPLAGKANGIAGVRSLELQAVGRYDSFTVFTTEPGSATINYLINGSITTSPNLLNGQREPFVRNPASKYNSSSGTVGFKYSPVDGLFFRWSFATGFVTPDFQQLLPPISAGTQTIPAAPAPYPGVPTTSPWPYSQITDPVLGATYNVPVISGGNPSLVPETSHGVDWGVVFEPVFAPGLRLSVDFTKITKFRDILAPGAAVLVANPGAFPNRVQRLSPTGPIVLIDNTYINAPETCSSSYNLAVDYTLRTVSLGTWKVSGSANSWQHYAIQSVPGGPFVEQLANPTVTASGSYGIGSGLAKFKGNLGLDWNRGRFMAGWFAHYVGPYNIGSIYGLGAPNQYGSGGIGGWIPGQIYHDVYVGYSTGRAGAGDHWWNRALANSTIRLAVDNVFDQFAPYDGNGGAPGFYSYYGDIRLATYILSFKKSL